MKDDAPLRQAIDATLDDMLFQLEARDAIGQQAAHTVVPVVDMHFISRLAQIFRRGETCGTSADDANGLPAIRAGHEWLDQTFFPCGIRDELFNRTNGDGAVAGKLNTACALAQPILRTYYPANLRHGQTNGRTAQRT